MAAGNVTVLLLFFSAVMRESLQQSAVCQSVLEVLDCSQDDPSPVCGTGGVTFDTRCDFAKAHCLDPSVHLQHSGQCLPGEQPAVDPICPQLTALTCPDTHPDQSVSVCASDGVSYPSLCQYQQARCRVPSLRLLSLGPCGAGTTATTTYSLICQAIRDLVCPSDLRPVCGSDSVTYDNACELEKAICQTPGLHMVSEQAC